MPGKILMFDDDYESMRDTKESLEIMLDCQIVLSADQSILKRLSDEQFDLVIIDQMIRPACYGENEVEVKNVVFEGVDWAVTGSEFFRRLRKGDFEGNNNCGTRRDVPVILVSAKAEQTDLQDMKFGRLVRMEKPFRLQDLAGIVSRLIDT